jgi:hypothetical protein
VNAREAMALCRFVKAACPQQAIDEFTPDVWHPLLEDLLFDDAKQALLNVAKAQPFVAPSEIRAEVKRIRAKRMLAFGELPDPPAEVAADPALFHPWLKATKRAIADGRVQSPADLGILPGKAAERPPLELNGVIRGVDDEESYDEEPVIAEEDQ